MSGRIFAHSHRVTYAECTAGNHVYFSRYLDIIESARGEFFRSMDSPLAGLQEAGTIFPVVECRIEYKKPARYDDLLVVELLLVELSRIRMKFEYRILSQNGEIIARVATSHVATGIDEKPRRMPPELLTRLQDWLMIKPENAE